MFPQIQITSIEQDKCYHIETSEIEEPILVRMFLVNKTQHFDPELTQACASILVDRGHGMTQLTNSTFKDTVCDYILLCGFVCLYVCMYVSTDMKGE